MALQNAPLGPQKPIWQKLKIAKQNAFSKSPPRAQKGSKKGVPERAKKSKMLVFVAWNWWFCLARFDSQGASEHTFGELEGASGEPFLVQKRLLSSTYFFSFYLAIKDKQT